MSANSKRTSRTTSGDGTLPDTELEGESGMYLRASRYREELMDEVRTLRRAGKIRAARSVESRMQQVEQLIGALEGEGKVGVASRPTSAGDH